jgi:hypothetical protein
MSAKSLRSQRHASDDEAGRLALISILASTTPQNPPGNTTIVGRSGNVARDTINVGESLNRTA